MDEHLVAKYSEIAHNKTRFRVFTLFWFVEPYMDTSIKKIIFSGHVQFSHSVWVIWGQTKCWGGYFGGTHFLFNHWQYVIYFWVKTAFFLPFLLHIHIIHNLNAEIRSETG